MNVFEILGPVMVGPSSSHTAGAVRIGNMARTLLGEEPKTAEIFLHGSFAATGKGHGTDKALIAGLLGLKTYDINIPDSFKLAEQKGLDFTFSEIALEDVHPNTVLINLTGKNGGKLKIQASSVGGGSIMVDRLDTIDVKFSGDYNTLVVHNLDRPGFVGEVATILSNSKINIANMSLYRDKRGGKAIMVLEIDQKIEREIIEKLKNIDGIVKVTYYGKEDN